MNSENKVPSFDISTVNRVHLGHPANPVWARALHVVAAATVALGSTIGAAGAPQHTINEAAPAPKPLNVERGTAPPERRRGIASQIAAGTNSAPLGAAIPQPTNGEFKTVSPASNPEIEKDPALKAAFESSLFLVAFDAASHRFYTGTGTLLKATDAGGAPGVLTVAHMLIYRDVGVHGYIAAFDHDRHYLGILEPISPQPANTGATPDGPVLLAFDPDYPINRRLVSGIPGVAIADEVPSIPFTGIAGGPEHGNVGIAPGDSGAAILVKQGGEYKALAVVSVETSDVVGHIVGIKSDPSMPPIYGAGLRGGVQYAEIRSETSAILAGLGEGEFLSELRSITPGQVKAKSVERVPSDRFYAFGYGLNIPTAIAGTFHVHTAEAARDLKLTRLAKAIELKAVSVSLVARKALEPAAEYSPATKKSVITSLGMSSDL